jgi:rare lipoprotein A
MRFRTLETALLIGLLVLSGCAKKKRTHVPAAPNIGDTESGVASWYGYPYHGRRAANGEIYDMEKMTAAHRTLPFGTWVDVQNLKNSRHVTVRITDRGPFIDGRIIDLSRAAARDIEMIGPGIAKVRLTIVSPPEILPVSDLYGVQVGAFQDRTRAERVRGTMAERFGPAKLVERGGSPIVWRVLVGRESTREAAEGLAARIRDEFGAAFVVRLDAEAAE